MRLFRRVCTTCAVGIVLSFALNAAADEVEITEDARQHFRAGVSFMQDPDGARYEEAYREFKAAYAAAPSWKILGNLGIASMKLERDGEAIAAFEKYLTEGGDRIDAAEQAQVRRDLDMLKAGVVTLTLTSTPPGAVFIDERVPVRGTPVTNQYEGTNGPLVIGVRPGVHRIRARMSGYEEAVWEIDAQSRTQQSHTFELKKPSAAAGSTGGAAQPGDSGVERPVPTSVYIGLAATGACAIGAGVTGALALGKKGDYDDANNGSDPAAAEDLRSDVKTMNLVTDIFLGAAVVGAGVTSYLYFTRPTVSEGSARIVWTPVVSNNAGMVSVSGQF